ncbi:ABC transporter substrate-binding protein [Palleronia sp. LCG004]|uniref:ABC transporter substrate-binding protein n=1 Tax=Palleronia sp. LCG004 TaxID=3079304 RepID=UPI002943A997|nr:ABC transporter substrate-binding protein [Palleronia sp. LCG004]WOI57486.1 ABC transporter substrate-binding protein [Palleronia sp. LCG004]
MQSTSRFLAGAALVAASTTTALAECQSMGGTIEAAMTTNASTMDPILSTTNASRQVSIYIFESLVTLDDAYQPIGQLAEDWERSENGLSYIFHLRENVPFHNGDILDADDVTASLQRFLASSPGAGRFDAVESVETVDPLTVRVTLSEDFPFITNLAMPSPVVAIMPKEIVDAAGSDEIRGEDIVGTGPFSLESWTPDVSIDLAKFEDYPTDERYEGPTGFGGARTACVDLVRLLPVTEESSRVAGIQTGDFDYAEAISITAVPELQESDEVNVEIVKPRWAIVLELDHRNPLMQNVAFRQALLAAIDPQQVLLASAFGREEYTRVQPSIFFPEQSGFYTEAGGDAYGTRDLDKVEDLLEEAGYDDEPVIYLTNQNYGWMFRASQAIAAQWREAGINVQTELMDWPSQIQRAQTQDDWAVNQTGWSPRFDPFQVLTSIQCDSISAFGYCDDEMQELLATISSGAEADERQTAWEDIQQKIWDDVVVLRVGDYFEPEATRAGLTGYEPFYVTPRFWDVSKAE